MFEIAQQLSSAGAGIAAVIWLPILIWTILAIAVILLMNMGKGIHVQYHYHTRLALLFALPAGLAITGLVELASGWLSSGMEAAAMKFIIVQAPVEITIGNTESTSLLMEPAFWYGTGSFVILAGIIILLFSHLRQFIRLQLLVRQVNLTPLHFLDIVSEQNKRLARNCGKPVSIACLDRSVIPVTFGVRKPVVLLPCELTADPEKMNLVLRHELIHIKNRDYLSHLVMAGIRMVFWIHPIVHLLYHQLIEYRELRCDSHVLSDDSISRKKYASVLLELLPMPNLNKDVSVNMAQESSNLKKRINMMKANTLRSIPFKASFALFCSVALAVVLVMSCTDMQQHNVLDEEDLDLMTNLDRTGERGYHEIIIFMGDQNQAGRHEDSIGQLESLQPEYIESINVLKGETAVEKYGSRGADGVLEIRTRQDIGSYNRALRALGMEPADPADFPEPGQEPYEDYHMVVRQMPELIGGLASIQRNIRYPEMARRAGIEGRVYIQFIVNEVGDVENAQVIRGIGGGADEEALRVVNEAKFRPGKHKGQPVRVMYSLPISFRLASSNDPDDQIDLSEVRSRNNNHERDPSVLHEFLVVGYNSPSYGRNIETTSDNTGVTYQNKAAELFEKRNSSLDNDTAEMYDEEAREMLVRAKDDFEQAVGENPDDEHAWRSLWKIYITLGMDEEAENTLQKARLD